MSISTTFTLLTCISLLSSLAGISRGDSSSSKCQCRADPKAYLGKPAFFAICTGIFFTYGDSKFTVETIRDAINQKIGPAFAADDKTGNYENTVAVAREEAIRAQVSEESVVLIERSVRNITVLSRNCGFCPEVGCSQLYPAAACYNRIIGLNTYE